MNSLRVISRKINLIMVVALFTLAISLVLSWHYHQSRNLSVYEEETYAAELLANGLPSKAAEIMREAIRKEPLSKRSIGLRKALADIYMTEMFDYEKALSELVFIQKFSPGDKTKVEKDIQICLKRLDRVYDFERRKLIEKGVNPVENEVASTTVIRIGNKPAMNLSVFKKRMEDLGVPENRINKQVLSAVAQNLAQELLITRASEREGYKEKEDFIQKLKQFERNLAIQEYLEKKVFNGINVSQNDVQAYLTNHPEEFSSPDRIQFSQYVFDSSEKAEAFAKNGDNKITSETGMTLEVEPDDASLVSPQVVPDSILVNQETKTRDQLPEMLKGINFDLLHDKKFFGPVKLGDKWNLFEIHKVLKGRKMDAQQAYSIASQKLMEARKQQALSDAIANLKIKEGLKINLDVLEAAFLKKEPEKKDEAPKASDKTPSTK